MNLLLFLSDRCNMACDYCFLSLNKGRAAVLPLEAARKAVERHEGPVTLLGGEPFIHFPLLKSIAALRPVTVVTNATLACPEKLKELQDLRARVVVSLDGAAGTHDRHRKGAALEESLRALESCDKGALRVNMVVREDTAAGLLGNIEFLRRSGFSKVSFHLNVLETWTPEGLKVLRRSLEGFVKYRAAVGGAVEFTHLASFARATSSHPCEDLVLGADGNYYPCDGLFSRPYSELSKWAVGSAREGVDWAKRARLLREAEAFIHRELGGGPHYNCALEPYFNAVAEGRDPGPAVRAFARADKVMGDALSGSPDFQVRRRDPRQDLQYGESLRLCDDPTPYLRERKALKNAPETFEALLRKGMVEAFLANFSGAERLLDRALRMRPGSGRALAWRGVARAMEARRRKTQEGLSFALADFDKALALGEDKAFVLPWRAELLHDLDRRQEALKDLEAAPQDAWARVEQGEILCELGRTEEAMARFDALVKEFPHASWAAALRGRTLATTGREKESLADLNRALALEPGSAACHAWLSESLRKLGRYRDALEHLDHAIGLDSRFVLAWVWRGRLKLLSGRTAEALGDLNRAIALDPRYLLAFAWRGEALFKLGRRTQAAADFERVAPMDLSRTWNAVVGEGTLLTAETRKAAYRQDRAALVSVMAAMARGRKRVDRKDFPGAIRCFDQALRLDPFCAQAFLYRAGLKLLAREEAGALEDFRAISRLDLSFLPAYRDLTTVSAEEFPELIPAAERVLRRDPKCAWAHVFHAFSLRSLMKYEEAIADLDRAVACEPQSAALRAMRSRVKLTNRQAFYDGVKDMQEAVRLAPEWGWLHCWLGEALRHQGDFKAALRALDEGLELDGSYRRGYAWRGGVLVALGRYKEAIADLDRSLEPNAIYDFDFEYTVDQKSWAYNQRMLAHRGLGDVAQAILDLNNAHAFGPRYGWVFNPKRDEKLFKKGLRELEAVASPWAHAWRGWTLLQWCKERGALEELDRAGKLAWALAWKGKALLNLGEPRKALKALDDALRLDPSYAPAWGWRGEARRILGRFREAASDFGRAIRLDHRAAWAFAGRGEAQRNFGDLKGSLSDLDRAISICPDYAEAFGWRAESRRLSGDYRGAVADADEALHLKPGLVLVYLTRSLAKGALKDFKGQIADFRRAEKLGAAS